MAFDALSRTPKLTTVQNVGIEISRIYRATKRGKISTPDGYRMVQMLAVLKTCLESATLEQPHRQDLEAQADTAARLSISGQGSFRNGRQHREADRGSGGKGQLTGSALDRHRG